MTISTHFAFFSFNFHFSCNFRNDLISLQNFEDLIDDSTAFLLSESKNNSYFLCQRQRLPCGKRTRGRYVWLSFINPNLSAVANIYWPYFLVSSTSGKLDYVAETDGNDFINSRLTKSCLATGFVFSFVFRLYCFLSSLNRKSHLTVSTRYTLIDINVSSLDFYMSLVFSE